MNSNILKEMYILVEGEKDKAFLEYYIKHKNPNLKYKIDVSSSYTNLKNRIEHLKKQINEGKRTCIIFDCDNNYEERKRFIGKVVSSLGEKIEIFLLPNNKDNGELETLLMNIATIDCIKKCFDNYMSCIKSCPNYEQIKKPIKSKFFAYCEALLSCTNEDIYKHENFGKYFNLESDELNALNDFLFKRV